MPTRPSCHRPGARSINVRHCTRPTLSYTSRELPRRLCGTQGARDRDGFSSQIVSNGLLLSVPGFAGLSLSLSPVPGLHSLFRRDCQSATGCPLSFHLDSPISMSTPGLEVDDFQSYFGVSAATVFFYDYFVTVDREVDLIWGTEWSLMKVLFLLTRYIPFLSTPLDLYYLLAPNMTFRTCLVTFMISRWLLCAGIVSAEVIIFIRTWVLWSRKRVIMVIISVTGIACFLCAAVGVSLWTESLVAAYNSTDLEPHNGRCLVINGSAIIGLSVIAVAIFETVVLALTILNMILQLRQTRGTTLRFSRLLRVLYRDGIAFFFWLFAVSMINVIFILAGPPVSTDLLIVMQHILHASSTTRVVLNLREAALPHYKDADQTVTAMEFNSPAGSYPMTDLSSSTSISTRIL